MEFQNKIEIILTQEVVDAYTKIYFKKYKTRRKPPIDSPIPPSLNKYLIWKRPQQNASKQKWKEFIMYVVEEYKDLMLEEAEIELEFTFKDRRRRDLDNYVSTSLKLIQDGLSAEEGIGMIIDDSYTVIKKVSATAHYEKGVEKLVIIIKY